MSVDQKTNQICFETLKFPTEPWSLENYLKIGGYKAWKKILDEKIDPLTIIDEVKKSPILHILDKAVPPTRKSSPKRLYFMFLFRVSIFTAFRGKSFDQRSITSLSFHSPAFC